MGEHQDYLATTMNDVAPRLKENVAGGVVETLRQSGLIGSGLGVATQGAQHFAVEARRDVWQEDGISRLFKELGIPGVLLALCAAIIAVRGCYQEVAQQKHLPLIELQGLVIALVFANFASFVASHQHFSGDPPNALWVLLFVGTFLGLLSLNRSGVVPGRPGEQRSGI